MNLDFKQAIFCYSLIHSVIITLASLTNQCLQAAIDASPAALLQKKKEEEEYWLWLVNDNREDIDDLKTLLSRIGFSIIKSQKYAEILAVVRLG